MAEEEVALDIEETNRLRAKLGLKPLNLAPAGAAKAKPQEPKEPAPADPEELRAKLTAAREKRRRETELRQTKTLGEADADVDDVGSWIQKIQPGQKATADPADPLAAGAKPRKRQKVAAEDSDDEAHTAADLAGVTVKHDIDELVEGETVILTLEDTAILDEKGKLVDGPDKLVDALAQQEKARRKARAAATKTAKPLWEEDGKVRGLLDKYDEEEEEAVAAFDAGGQLLAQQKRQDELRSKLAAGAALLDSADGTAAAAAGDYYTPEELAAAKDGGRKKKKKRKLRTTKVEDDDAGGLDLDALEAAAAAEGAADLGSREAREARKQQQEQARAAAAAERAARFEAALGRANVASEALRQTPAQLKGDADLDGDEADDELAASLARARRLAQKAAKASSSAADAGGAEAVAAASDGDGGGGGSSLEEIARQLAKKREEDEAKLKEQIASGAVEAFTETTEFVRSIQVEQPKAADEGSYMDVDEQPAAAEAAVPTPLPPPPVESKPPAKARQRNLRKGGWTTVDGEEDEEQQQQDASANGQQHGKRRLAPELEDTGVVGEKAMGKGLAATLSLLKDKGFLKEKVQWAGRTNDKKPVALIGLHDVYTGGSHDDAMAQRIEVALTQKDEFGRVMTPKERFRVMCHQFHGMAPSKNKQEERQRKYLEEVAVAQATSSENPSAQLDKLKELQRKTGTAYIPLTGKLKPGAAVARDAPSGLASARTAVAATPVLGGGMTPLAGNKKVEMMLGISKGSGSMPPPAPRR